MTKSKPNRICNAMLAIRTTDEVAEQYRRMCETTNLSQAALLYQLMGGATIIVVDGIRDMWIEQRKQGSNLNQAVKHLNEFAPSAQEEVLEALRANRHILKVTTDIMTLQKEKLIS